MTLGASKLLPITVEVTMTSTVGLHMFLLGRMSLISLPSQSYLAYTVVASPASRWSNQIEWVVSIILHILHDSSQRIIYLLRSGWRDNGPVSLMCITRVVKVACRQIIKIVVNPMLALWKDVPSLFTEDSGLRFEQTNQSFHFIKTSQAEC